MRIKAIAFNNIKSFEGLDRVDFDVETKMFAFSGKNGAGKSTLLRLPWLIQKAHFIETESVVDPRPEFHAEVMRYLTAPDSYAELFLEIDGSENSIRLCRDGGTYRLEHSDKTQLEKYWNSASPNNLVLYIDASKGFSEDTLQFDDLTIAQNDKRQILLQAVYSPSQLFSGIYQQLVKDYIHDRLLPSKPDRLLYYHVASKIFTKLIPNIELRRFSGNHRPGEFVLLGKAGKSTTTTFYDVREFSSGEKSLLCTLAFLCISKSVIALIIDEPENHFHESLLLEFMSVLHQLTGKAGIHSLISGNSASGKKIKNDWIEGEYRDYQLDQVIVSTHSKSLIYKFFTLGKNYSVADKVAEMVYEKAECMLRQLGLSTIYSKVILVEGAGDNAALEAALKGRNVKIKPLDGSGPVIETFRRLSEISSYFTESRFVFVVDSDNKPTSFFEELEAANQDFYRESFVCLDVHEFENLFLDESLFIEVLDIYLTTRGRSPTSRTLPEVKAILVDKARESLPQVYKKELSLSFQHVVERHFAGLVWGNKSFQWDNITTVNQNLTSNLTQKTSANLNDALLQEASTVFKRYSTISDQSLLDRCDGKQVLRKACSHFAGEAGVTHKTFLDAIYHAGINSPRSKVFSVVTDLIKRLDRV